MRRSFLILLCLSLLILPVGAVSGISSAESTNTVASDGSCQTSVTFTLVIEEPQTGLVFPLPEDARNISVNGVSAKTSYGSHTRNVDLADLFSGVGTGTVTIRYELPKAVRPVKKGGPLQLQLQLLSGFSLPVDNMHFSVTLPGEPEAVPVFTSTYHQETVNTIMHLSTEGNVISGSFSQRLQDHETLSMVLPVSSAMFPQPRGIQWTMNTVDLLTIVCCLLAFLYWLIFMRCPPPRKVLRASPPVGFTAGELGCRLAGQGVDFTMTVLSWASMGYLLIQPDDNGRVLLHKRMEMGNERSEFENRYFKDLFGKRQMVDGTGYHYARLCRKARHAVPGRQLCFLKRSGNPKFFRFAAALAGVFNGISLAAAFSADTGWRTVLSVVLGILGFLCAWQIHSGAGNLRSRNKASLWGGIAAAAGWILLSIPSGGWAISLPVVLFQILAGLAAAYGGRRSESGMQLMTDILGLRRFLKTADTANLRRILKTNPNYYYDIMPYAMALDADRALTKKLGKVRLPQCTYLTTGLDGHLTAQEWNRLLRDTVRSLDTVQKRLPLDRILGR